MYPWSHSCFQIVVTLIYFLGHFITPSFAQQAWIEVDDTDPSIQYYGYWLQGPCGPTCLTPNMSGIFNETWHIAKPTESTGDASLTFQFVGYAVLIGALLDDADPGVETNLVITLDGVSVGSVHTSADDGTIQTNAVVFKNFTLEYGLHSLTIDVAAGTIFALDYIAYEYSDGSDPPQGGGSGDSTSSTTQGPTQGGGSQPPTSTPSPTSRSSTTSFSVSTGPSGTATVPITIPLSTDGVTTFNPSTITGNNILAHTLDDISTSVDSSGHTFLIPLTTGAGDGPADPANPSNSHGSSNSSKSGIAFSPALAGAIGAAVAAVSAVIIVLLMFCLRKRRDMSRRLRSGGAEPYILAGSATPSTASSNLSPPLSPMPYSPESVLGLFVGPQTIPDYPPYRPPPNQQFDLLASPPPGSLSTPISPNQPYPYPVTHKIISSSNSRGYTPRRQSEMAELRSPVTPLMISRPNDWDIEGNTGTHTNTHTGTGQTGTGQTPVLTVPPSPLVTIPSPHGSHPSRRRSGRQKEQLEPTLPPVPLPNVPVLRQPSALMRSRRGTNTQGDPGMLPNVVPNSRDRGSGIGNGSGIGSDEESLPPVLRRQSLSHPAPPAYSPPRLVRNADLHDS